jgi:SecD/SecF fusion protein
MLGSTLTLPGIAGIILTIGMAVDANVLVYERMRDEFALGKSVRAGVESGFSNAFWSIVDAQVTTLITALVLFLFGTGPIKGFAVTLTLGIIFNLFAVLFVCHLIYDSLFSLKKIKKITFFQLVHKANFDFMAKRKIAFSFSAALVLLGLVAFVQIVRGQANLGIDFSGGTMLQYKTAMSFSLHEVRETLKNNGFEGIDLQQVTSVKPTDRQAETHREKIGDVSDRISATLRHSLPEKDFFLESKSEIGASVSANLRSKAFFPSVCRSLASSSTWASASTFGSAWPLPQPPSTMSWPSWVYLLDNGHGVDPLIITALLTLAGYSLQRYGCLF